MLPFAHQSTSTVCVCVRRSLKSTRDVWEDSSVRSMLTKNTSMWRSSRCARRRRRRKWTRRQRSACWCCAQRSTWSSCSESSYPKSPCRPRRRSPRSQTEISCAPCGSTAPSSSWCARLQRTQTRTRSVLGSHLRRQ